MNTPSRRELKILGTKCLSAFGKQQRLGNVVLPTGSIILMCKNNYTSFILLVGKGGVFVFDPNTRKDWIGWIKEEDCGAGKDLDLRKRAVYNVVYQRIEKISAPFSVIDWFVGHLTYTSLTQNALNEMRVWLLCNLPAFTWVKRVVPVLKEARDEYYNTGESHLTDEEYDFIEDRLREVSPNAPFLKNIGAETRNRKRDLPVPMASMDKVKAGTGQAQDFVSKLVRITPQAKILVPVKVDGVSAALQYKDGNLIAAFSRGDGFVGQDILKHVLLIPDVPRKLEKSTTCVIRGEIVMPNSVFAKKFSEDFANPRNMVSGLINSKTLNAAGLKACKFLAHDVMGAKLSAVSKYEWMEKKFDTVPHKILKGTKVTDGLLSNMLSEFRDKLDYDIDGLIVTVSDKSLIERTKGDNPQYSRAFKENAKALEAIVGKVEWNASRYGVLKPLIWFKTPVKHLGVSIKKATGHNASYIKDNGIGPGAKVKVVRSGDVIPYVTQVLTSVRPQLPDKSVKWEWNATGVDIVLKEGTSNDQQAVKSLAHFFTAIGVDGVARGIIERLYDHGHTSVPDILSLTKHQLMEVEGIQEKSATKMWENIHSALYDIELPVLCYASTCFGHSLGTRRFYRLWKEYGNDMCSWSGWSKSDMIEELSSLSGFGVVAAKQFAENIGDFVRFFKQVRKWVKLASFKKEKKLSSKLSGKQFVFTGVRLPDVEKIIEENGGIVSNSVNKNTTILIMKEIGSGSAKEKTANDLGIKIMVVPKFKKWLENLGLI